PRRYPWQDLRGGGRADRRGGRSDRSTCRRAGQRRRLWPGGSHGTRRARCRARRIGGPGRRQPLQARRRQGRLLRDCGGIFGQFQPGDHGFAGFLLDLADAIFELQAVLGDIARRQRRIEAAQLPHERGPRLLVNSSPCGAIVFGKGLDRLTYELFVIRHWLFETLPGHAQCSSKLSQSWNGSWTRMVSSRSGLVDSIATGAPISSSIYRTYLTACAGSSDQLRAPAVVPDQPSKDS